MNFSTQNNRVGYVLLIGSLAFFSGWDQQAAAKIHAAEDKQRPFAELPRLGVTEVDSPIHFVYDGDAMRRLPEGRIAAETFREETTEPESIPGDRFSRGAIFTSKHEEVDLVSGLVITTEITTYEDFPEVIEWVAWFENRGDRPTPNLRNVLAADILLCTGGEVTLEHGMGENNDPKENYSFCIEPLENEDIREFSPREAYPSFYAFPYFRLNGKERAYTLAVGWAGEWSTSFTANADGKVRFTAGQKRVDLYLKPGEKIRTPRITLFSYPPETDSVNLWRRWLREYILPRQHGKVIGPKLILDAHTGGELYKDITEEQQIAMIRTMRAKGFRCDGLWIDAGWYLRKNSPKTSVGYWFLTGDWTPDPERFPNGMAPLAAELGPDADFVLWYEPERIHRDAPTFEAYKKYVVPNCEIIESYRMNLASAETVTFLSELIGDSLCENGVTIYRQDSNGAGPGPFLAHLEKTDPNFLDRQGMAENLYVQGYETFWKNLKKKNPHLVIDTCASGGRRNDLDTLRMGAVPLHYSDVGYFDFLDKQRYHDLLDRWFIYYKNIDAHDWDGVKNEYDPYYTTIDFSPFTTLRPYIFEHDTPANRQYVERFLSVGDLWVNGDYYLLEGGFTAESWTVTQHHDAPRGVGCIRMIRNPDSPNETQTIRFRALDPLQTYRLKNLDTGVTTEQSGHLLLDIGYEVTMPPRSGQIIRYEAVAP